MDNSQAKAMAAALDPDRECPIVYAMNILSSKWMMPIIWHLLVDGDMSFNELSRKVGGISNTMLTRCLKQLVQNGLIVKTDCGGTPPRVIYSLSEIGEGLIPTMQCLFQWGNMVMDKAEEKDGVSDT